MDFDMEFAAVPFSYGLGLVIAGYVAGMAVSAVFNAIKMVG